MNGMERNRTEQNKYCGVVEYLNYYFFPNYSEKLTINCEQQKVFIEILLLYYKLKPNAFSRISLNLINCVYFDGLC